MQAQYSDHLAPAHGPQSVQTPDPSTSPLPYTPLPKRRGTAPTVFLVAIALVIPALIFGVPALASGGDGESGSNQVATDPKGTDPEPVDPEPVDPEPVDPEPVVPEPVDPEPVGPTVTGAGYVYAVPDGWGIRPDMVREFSLDEGDSVVAVSQPDHGFDTNMLVTANAAGNLTTIEKAREAWMPQDGNVEPLAPATLDGVQAIGLRNETVNDAGRPIVQLGYLTVRDGQIYSIVLSVPVQSENTSRPAFDAVLESWSWAEGPQSPATTA